MFLSCRLDIIIIIIVIILIIIILLLIIIVVLSCAYCQIASRSAPLACKIIWENFSTKMNNSGFPFSVEIS